MRQRGFTLIELMVTLVIFGILVSVGLPSFSNMTKDYRLVSEQRSLIAMLNMARSEASHRGQVVTIASKGGSNWSKGFQIYTDADAAGNTAYNAASDVLIKDLDASSTGITINSSSSADDGYISFRNNGGLNEGAGVTSLTLALCDTRGKDHGHALELNFVGQAKLSTPATCSP